MDSFEKMIKEMGSVDEASRQASIGRLRSECICPDCPSYNKCAGDGSELLYCFVGRSASCIKDELGCICPQCPVAAQADLVNLYYCTVGSETEMRG